MDHVNGWEQQISLIMEETTGWEYHFLGMSDELGFIFIEIRRQVNKFLNLTNVYNINHLY